MSLTILPHWFDDWRAADAKSKLFSTFAALQALYVGREVRPFWHFLHGFIVIHMMNVGFGCRVGIVLDGVLCSLAEGMRTTVSVHYVQVAIELLHPKMT